MTLVAPDILKECLDLSPGTTLLALAIGCALWLLGGWGHRFCTVLLTTLIAGVVGLRSAPVWGMQPLVAGLLLAVSAGALAMSLVRVGVFLGVGVGLLYLARLIAPTWDEPVAVFVAGGLLGVLLFRFWIMAAASLAGTLLMAYSILCLLARYARMDVASWAEKNGPLLNWSIMSVAVLGILLQLLLMRRGKNAKGKAKGEEKPEAKGDGKGDGKPKAEGKPPAPPPRPLWLRWLPLGGQKKAG